MLPSSTYYSFGLTIRKSYQKLMITIAVTKDIGTTFNKKTTIRSSD